MKRIGLACFAFFLVCACCSPLKRAVAQTPPSCETFVKEADAKADEWRKSGRKDATLFSKAKSTYYKATDLFPKCLSAWKGLYAIAKEGKDFDTYCLSGLEVIKLTAKGEFTEDNRKFVEGFCEGKGALPKGTFEKFKAEKQQAKSEVESSISQPSLPVVVFDSKIFSKPPQNSNALLTMMPPPATVGPPKPKEAPSQAVRPNGMENTPLPRLESAVAKESQPTPSAPTFVKPMEEKPEPVPAVQKPEEKPPVEKSVVAVAPVLRTPEKKPLAEKVSPKSPVDVSDVPVVDTTPPPISLSQVMSSKPPSPKKPEMAVPETTKVPSSFIPPKGKKNCLSSPFQGDFVTSKDDADLKLLDKPHGALGSFAAQWPANTPATLRQREGVWALVELPNKKKGWVLWGSVCRFDPSAKGNTLEAVAENVASSGAPKESQSVPTTQPSVAEASTPAVKKVAPTPPVEKPPLPPPKTEKVAMANPSEKSDVPAQAKPPRVETAEKASPYETKKVPPAEAKRSAFSKDAVAKKEPPSAPLPNDVFSKASPSLEKSKVESPRQPKEENRMATRHVSAEPMTPSELFQGVESGKFGKPFLARDKDGSPMLLFPILEPVEHSSQKKNNRDKDHSGLRRESEQ